MSKPDEHRYGTYTYLDYTMWDGPERWEIIEGVPHMMAIPTPEHQQILGQLFLQIGGYSQGKSCTTYIAPLDLTFEENKQTNKVVQPDLFVMCGEYGNDKRIIGVPVLIIEILSPSTATHDLIRKLNLYQKAGVKEYWVVDPEDKTINVFLHDGALLRWTEEEHKPGDRLNPTMVPDLIIDVGVIFA